MNERRLIRFSETSTLMCACRRVVRNVNNGDVYVVTLCLTLVSLDVEVCSLHSSSAFQC